MMISWVVYGMALLKKSSAQRKARRQQTGINVLFKFVNLNSVFCLFLPFLLCISVIRSTIKHAIKYTAKEKISVFRMSPAEIGASVLKWFETGTIISKINIKIYAGVR